MIYIVSSMTMSVDIVLMALYLRKLFQFMILTASRSPRLETNATCSIQSNQPSRNHVPSVSSNMAGMETSSAPPAPFVLRVQPSMMATVTRTTILTLFAIVSSTALQSTRIILLATGHIYDIPYLISTLRSVDCAINAWALYFSFGFGTSNYRRLCKLCDRAMSSCCSKLALHAIIQRKTSASSKNVRYVP